jgi:hypothetical protein
MGACLRDNKKTELPTDVLVDYADIVAPDPDRDRDNALV